MGHVPWLCWIARGYNVRKGVGHHPNSTMVDSPWSWNIRSVMKCPKWTCGKCGTFDDLPPWRVNWRGIYLPKCLNLLKSQGNMFMMLQQIMKQNSTISLQVGVWVSISSDSLVCDIMFARRLTIASPFCFCCFFKPRILIR